MANSTVYPYGTNGELPSSIGIINDLTTGGADKALSAEMGKELAQDIENEIIDAANYGTVGYTVGTNGKWYTAATHQNSKIIFLPEGISAIILSPTPTSSGMAWTLLSSYTPPTETAQAISTIASGTDARYTATTEVTITEWSDAKFICVRADDTGYNYFECPIVKFIYEKQFKSTVKEALLDNGTGINRLEETVYSGEQIPFGDLIAGYIEDDGKWLKYSSNNTNLSAHYEIGVSYGRLYRITASNSIDSIAYWLSESETAVSGSATPIIGSKIVIKAGTSKIITPPVNAAYLYLGAAYCLGRLAPILVEQIESHSDSLFDVIPDYIVTYPEKIKVETISEQIGSISSSGTWITDYTGGKTKHKVISVQPGEKYVINGDGNGFWAWLSSSYEVPVVKNSSAPLVSGYNRELQKDSVAVTVPSGAAYLYLTTVNGAGGTSSWTIYKVASYQRRFNAPVKFRYASWNIGLFVYTNWEVDGPTHVIPANEADEYAEKYKTLINDVDADILGICEYNPSFSAANLSTKNDIFQCYKNIYEGTKTGANCNTLMFNSDVEYVGKEEHTYNDTEYNRYYVHMTTRIAGENVHIVQTHLDHTYNAMRVSEINEIIAAMSGYKYVIIAGDFNTGDEESIDAELAAFKNAGYTLANCGYLGHVITSLTQEFVDNIVVKGFSMSNIQVRQDSGTLSDHLLICANLKMDFE